MTDAKPFASLRPTLLARKGGAKPAMRPQAMPIMNFESNAAFQIEDDLGWNDMGEDADFHSVAEVVPLTPAHPVANTRGKPVIRRQQEAIAEKLGDQPRRNALEDGRRAAFTLRLDAERHLRLRLACTIRNRSAQQIVTEALDALLSDMPELESLAHQVRRK